MALNLKTIQQDIDDLRNRLNFKQVKYGIASDFIGEALCCNVLGVASDTGAIYYADNTGTWQIVNTGSASGPESVLFTTTDGNLNSALTIAVANGEAVDIDVNYIGKKPDGSGAVAGRMNASAFKTAAGVLTVGGNQYPRAEVYYGTAAGASANITNNGSGGVSINVVGQGATTYDWKIFYTIKRH